MPRSLLLLQKIWDNTAGDEFAKALALFREYTQLGIDNDTCAAARYRFFKGYWGNNFGAEIAEAIVELDKEALLIDTPKKHKLILDFNEEETKESSSGQDVYDDVYDSELCKLLKKIQNIVWTKCNDENPMNQDGDVANILRIIQRNTNLWCFNEIVLKYVGEEFELPICRKSPALP